MSFLDVTVQVIADFNKLKQISNDLHLVVKAMKSSSLLQVCNSIFLIHPAVVTSLRFSHYTEILRTFPENLLF